MKLNLNVHEIVDMKKTFPLNQVFKKHIFCENMNMKRNCNEIMNLKSIFVWKREFEIESHKKYKLWKNQDIIH